MYLEMEDLQVNAAGTQLNDDNIKLDSYSNTKHFFIMLSHEHFRFWGLERLSNRSISKHYPMQRAMPFHEWKNVQLQERCPPLMTQDSTGHPKTLCTSVSSLSSGMAGVWILSQRAWFSCQQEVSVALTKTPPIHYYIVVDSALCNYAG